LCAVLFAARGTTSGFATTKRAGERRREKRRREERSKASEIERLRKTEERRGKRREKERGRTERTSFEKSLMESLGSGKAVRAREKRMYGDK